MEIVGRCVNAVVRPDRSVQIWRAVLQFRKQEVSEWVRYGLSRHKAGAFAVCRVPTENKRGPSCSFFLLSAGSEWHLRHAVTAVKV